jgi:hypothetical protein
MNKLNANEQEAITSASTDDLYRWAADLEGSAETWAIVTLAAVWAELYNRVPSEA